MPEFPLTGGCLCGGVRFEVTEPIISANYCHCTRCQRRTGSAASVQGRIAPGSLRVTAGEELLRAARPVRESVLLALRLSALEPPSGNPGCTRRPHGRL